jgi:hypothetical protein
MRNKSIVCAVTVALTLSGCSSRPREFAPQLATPPASSAALDASTAECSQLLIAGQLDRNGRVGSGAAGAAAGGAVAVAGGAAASSAGLAGGAALASATVVLLPFVAIGGAWGMAKMKRAKKERAIKAAMAGCLQERGHQVTGWEKTGRKVPRAVSKASSSPAN